MIRKPVRIFLLGFILLAATAAVARTGHLAAAKSFPGHAVQVAAHAMPMAGGWTFQGCWTPGGGAPCRDVYTDGQGDHWICKPCGTTGNPSKGKCTPISSAALAAGLWCS